MGPFNRQEVETAVEESYRRDVAIGSAGLNERAKNWRGSMLGF